jgi:hypothetical protein
MTGIPTIRFCLQRSIRESDHQARPNHQAEIEGETVTCQNQRRSGLLMEARKARTRNRAQGVTEGAGTLMHLNPKRVLAAMMFKIIKTRAADHRSVTKRMTIDRLIHLWWNLAPTSPSANGQFSPGASDDVVSFEMAGRALQNLWTSGGRVDTYMSIMSSWPWFLPLYVVADCEFVRLDQVNNGFAKVRYRIMLGQGII